MSTDRNVMVMPIRIDTLIQIVGSNQKSADSKLYEFDPVVRSHSQIYKLCLTTIARWYQSFPSRTGQ